MLNSSNYYSAEADKKYMSVSQFKDFHGTYGIPGCERTAMMRLLGLYPKKEGLPLLVGGYVDAWFEGTLDLFVENHPEMFRKDGVLKADFVKADYLIQRVQEDPMFMYYMSGEKQVIMTGEIDGIPWKIKIDSLLPDAIVDLKIVAEINKRKWVQDIGEYLDFVRYWGYDMQGAVYQEIVRQNTGKKLPFIIAAASKEEPEPVMELIEVDQVYLDEAMSIIRNDTPRIVEIKKGNEEPTQCNICPCCRKEKVLTGTVLLSQMFNQR